MAAGALEVKPLISHRYAIGQAVEAYRLLDDPTTLGILLEYPEQDGQGLRNPVVPSTPPQPIRMRFGEIRRLILLPL